MTINGSSQPPEAGTTKGTVRLDIAAAGLLAAIATAVSVVYLASPVGSIVDADEAVFGLMAQMIASFKEFPVFCWEAHYAGAVVSYFAAVIFKVFGAGFIQLKCGMLPFAIGAPVVCYFIYKKMFGSFSAFLGALLIIFCPYFILKYKMAAVGGYGETLLGSALIVFLSWRLMDHPEKPGLQSLFLGLVSGFFFYIGFLVAPAIVVFAPIAIWSLKTNRVRNTLLFCSGGFIGILPMIVYNVTTGGGTLVRAISRGTWLERSDIHASFGTILSKTIENKLLYLKTWFMSSPSLFGSYIMPESMSGIARNIAGLVLIGILALFLRNAFLAVKSADRWSYWRRGEWQFALFFIALIGFIWIPNLDRTRHLMPLLIIMPVAVLSIINKITQRTMAKNILTLVFLSLCGLNVWGWAGPMKKMNFDPRPVVNEMKAKNVRYFYGSYSMAYPIMFASNGSLVGSPQLLSYGEPASDRRPDYTKAVRNSANPAFFFDRSEAALQKRFKDFLSVNNVSYESMTSSTGTLFYNFSRPIDAVVKTHWVTDFVVRDSQQPLQK